MTQHPLTPPAPTNLKAPMTTPSSVPGINVLLIGGTGSGKTYSLRTLLDAGITPFILFTEPGQEVLSDLPADKCHWAYIAPVQTTLDSIIDRATKVAQLSLESLAKMVDSTRSVDNRFLKMVQMLNNFKCDRTGESFGPVASWGQDRALVIDSLSGLSLAAMANVIGNKPVASMADWGMAQSQLEQVINWCCMSTQAHFVMIAHAEREVDEVMGGQQIMASTLGRKLAPKLPRFFSDVILAKREGTKFSWNTATANADLKARNLPIADGQEASFAPLIRLWKRRSDAGRQAPAL